MNTLLAQYTIRSKQDYIFKTNKIVEIVGASSHVRDAWKYLFQCAQNLGMQVKRADDGGYNHRQVLSAFDKKELQIVELFCGGGNETLLFDSYESFLAVNRAFSYYLLKECPGMIPMAVYVPMTENYASDYQNLMTAAETEKNRMAPGQNTFVLPFTMMDRETFAPMTRINSMEGELRRYSEESYSKRTKGIGERNKDRAVQFLDSMVTRKGEESLLAVVHADGNNMGSKIMEMLKGKNSYEECVTIMREFTKDTAKAFSDCGLRAIEAKRKELAEIVKKQDVLAYRVIIKDGDDMTFICNARYVMEYVKAYIEAVQNYESKWKYSSCAGICIFHSHYPFAKAYHLAEQACDDGAKARVHKVNESGEPLIVEEGWVDFHYIHSGIGGELKMIRREHNTDSCMARPWLIVGETDTKFKLDSLYRLNTLVQENLLGRAWIKGISAAAEESEETGLRELHRIFNHHSGLEDKLNDLFGDEKQQLRAFYDLSEIYDLWFKGDK